MIERNMTMLWAIALMALTFWMLGMFSSHTYGGLIHVLLAVALVVVCIRLFYRNRIAA